MSVYHVPVMLDVVIHALHPESGKIFVDATVGGGGYAEELVKRGAIVIGLDKDTEAIAESKIRLESYDSGNWKLIQDDYRNIGDVLKSLKIKRISGIIYDLGVSSHQLDAITRGFSYRYEGAALDLRFNQNSGIPANEYLNHADKELLYEIFSKYGEEKYFRSIADAIVSSRSVKPVNTMSDLMLILNRVISDHAELMRSKRRILQALRIAVNDELESLKISLSQIVDLLEPDGVVAVLSYHSLEDRIVKNYFRNNRRMYNIKHFILPSNSEQKTNPRSSSAKLRIAIRK